MSLNRKLFVLVKTISTIKSVGHMDSLCTRDRTYTIYLKQKDSLNIWKKKKKSSLLNFQPEIVHFAKGDKSVLI